MRAPLVAALAAGCAIAIALWQLGAATTGLSIDRVAGIGSGEEAKPGASVATIGCRVR